MYLLHNVRKCERILNVANEFCGILDKKTPCWSVSQVLNYEKNSKFASEK